MPCAGPAWAVRGGPQKKIVYWVLSSRNAEYTGKRHRFYLRFYRRGWGVYSGRLEINTQ